MSSKSKCNTYFSCKKNFIFKVEMSILKSDEWKYDSNKLKKHNVIPYFNLSILNQSLIPNNILHK